MIDHRNGLQQLVDELRHEQQTKQLYDILIQKREAKRNQKKQIEQEQSIFSYEILSSDNGLEAIDNMITNYINFTDKETIEQQKNIFKMVLNVRPNIDDTLYNTSNENIISIVIGNIITNHNIFDILYNTSDENIISTVMGDINYIYDIVNICDMLYNEVNRVNIINTLLRDYIFDLFGNDIEYINFVSVIENIKQKINDLISTIVSSICIFYGLFSVLTEDFGLTDDEYRIIYEKFDKKNCSLLCIVSSCYEYSKDHDNIEISQNIHINKRMFISLWNYINETINDKGICLLICVLSFYFNTYTMYETPDFIYNLVNNKEINQLDLDMRSRLYMFINTLSFCNRDNITIDAVYNSAFDDSEELTCDDIININEYIKSVKYYAYVISFIVNSSDMEDYKELIGNGYKITDENIYKPSYITELFWKPYRLSYDE